MRSFDARLEKLKAAIKQQGAGALCCAALTRDRFELEAQHYFAGTEPPPLTCSRHANERPLCETAYDLIARSQERSQNLLADFQGMDDDTF